MFGLLAFAGSNPSKAQRCVPLTSTQTMLQYHQRQLVITGTSNHGHKARSPLSSYHNHHPTIQSVITNVAAITIIMQDARNCNLGQPVINCSHCRNRLYCHGLILNHFAFAAFTPAASTTLSPTHLHDAGMRLRQLQSLQED